MPGFGTVITGALIAGTLTAGSRAELVPGGPQVRVRQVQVHNEKVDRAEAGQRTAANLVGVEEAQIRRGHVLAEPGAIAVTERLDARLRLLKSAPHPLKNRDRVHFYTGTAEVLARVRLLDCEVLEPGREALVQWVLEEPVALARQDAYVVRSYSPLFTIGGGKVIRAIAPSYRSSQKDVVDMLRRIEHGEPRDLVLVALEEGELIRTAPVLARQVGISQSPVKEILDSAAGNGEVHKLEGEGGPYYAGGERLSGVKERLTEIVSSYHRGYQWQPGILKEELRQRLAEELTSRTMNLLLDLWQRERVVNVDGNYVSIPGFTVAFTGDAKVLVDAILKAVKEGNLQPPLFSEIRPTLPKVKSSGLDAGEIWDALCARGDLRRITDDLAYTPEVYNRAKSSLIAVLRQKGEITVAGFRDLLQVSRKYSLPLLEHFDHERVTLRAGDARRLNPAYVDSSDPESPITQSTEVES
jgi:selenocysteine-specific elongation factor